MEARGQVKGRKWSNDDVDYPLMGGVRKKGGTEITYKTCKRCGELKRITEFYKTNNNRRQAVCIDCVNKRTRERYASKRAASNTKTDGLD